jgi:hypothetical protein
MVVALDLVSRFDLHAGFRGCSHLSKMLFRYTWKSVVFAEKSEKADRMIDSDLNAIRGLHLQPSSWFPSKCLAQCLLVEKCV